MSENKLFVKVKYQNYYYTIFFPFFLLDYIVFNIFFRLSKLLRHRGPDWNGIACFRNSILTHERLAIVGLNSGAQPIIDQDGDTAMSVNGEIYNHRYTIVQFHEFFCLCQE